MPGYIRDIRLKGLVAFERVALSARFPVLPPLLARIALSALKAELDPLSFDGTRDERATDGHPGRALAPQTPALCFGMVHGAEPAGETADTDIGILDLHDCCYLRYPERYPL